MVSTWAGLRETAARLAAAFDPSRVPVASAEALVGELARIEAIVATVKAQAAARVAASERWRLSGARSPEDHLARQTGSTVRQAKTVIATGAALADLPAVRDAAARGDLSPAQTALVADAAAAARAAGDAGSGELLVERARTASLTELGAECEAVKQRADREPDETRRRIRRERAVRRWSAGGVGHLHMSGPIEDVAEVELAFRERREALFREARAEGRRETPEAYDYDALLATVRAGRESAATGPRVPEAGSRPPARLPRWAGAKVLVRVDYETLVRGHPIEGEVCEIVGLGPVPVSVVEQVHAEGGFLAAVLTKAQRVQSVAHLGRAFTATQTSALEWTNPRCAAEGCGRHARLEKDHRTPWASSHVTLVDEADRLCEADHDLRTHHGWSLVDGAGTRPFVAPGDARHPRHRREALPGSDPPTCRAG